MFKKVTIIGVGLLGGSLGLAIKKNNLAKQIVGFFRQPDKIKKAVKMGVIDIGTGDLAAAVRDSDLIILCSPVNDIINKLAELKKLISPDAIITDVGSTKFEISNAAKKLNFIGSHPLSGSEQTGITFARANLFEKSICILTPIAKTRHTTLKVLKKFWKAIGSQTIILTPQEHDHILALTSHLPHAIAFSLINSIPKILLKFSAGGLKDTTRIALSNPKIWVEIMASNKQEILKALRIFENNLGEIKTALACGNSDKLLKLYSQAQKKRQQF